MCGDGKDDVVASVVGVCPQPCVRIRAQTHIHDTTHKHMHTTPHAQTHRGSSDGEPLEMRKPAVAHPTVSTSETERTLPLRPLMPAEECHLPVTP